MQRIRLRRRPVRADSVRKHGERRCCIVSAQLLGHVNEERARLPKWVLVLKPEANFCVPVLLSMNVELASEVMLSMKVALSSVSSGLIVA